MPFSAAARFRLTLVAGTTAVVIGSGFTVAGLAQHAAEKANTVSADVPLAAAVSASPGGASEGELLLEDLASASPSLSASASPSASSSSAAVKKKASSSPAKTTSPAATKTTSKTAAAAVATADSILDQVVAHINEARADEGLDPLTLDDDLSKASALHNQLMIDGCGLSHQCSGESGIGDRFSAQGVSWSTAGENIGYASSGSSTSAMVSAANGLTDSMLAEVAPNDGHRKNLLNADFDRIGLSVVRDGDGITWMTQDFVG
ncbi:CAP domain-containing protein [Actinoplanes sp. NPDC051851]|uniref:CAP domain-containing protein n=1 Tax=Actinoplanes sp. NPDC051851 TaxID=3154753 RepID=UPI00341FC222